MESARFGLKIFLILLIAITLGGTFGFMVLEKTSLFDALYFSIVTIATVGYGDITPSTPAGKMFAIFLIITGVGIFLGVIANSTDLLLSKREKKMRMEKLNMVIGVFFSECGTDLIRMFCHYDARGDILGEHLTVSKEWTSQDFLKAKTYLGSYRYEIDRGKVDLAELKQVLSIKGELLLRLFENPFLLEHQSFTGLLRAVLHLKEELLHREDLEHLPEPDRDHIANDMLRAYGLLISEWIDYMKYLQKAYPYLFSLAVRLNPFDRKASVVITHG